MAARTPSGTEISVAAAVMMRVPNTAGPMPDPIVRKFGISLVKKSPLMTPAPFFTTYQRTKTRGIKATSTASHTAAVASRFLTRRPRVSVRWERSKEAAATTLTTLPRDPA